MGKRSRSFNFLIELLIVIVFFTISSIICVNVFAKASYQNKLAKNISEATLDVQNIIESLKIDDTMIQDTIDKDNYKISITLLDTNATSNNNYYTYKICAYTEKEELISVETTCVRGK